MMSRRPPSDGDSSRSDALPDCCRAIGARLVEARLSRQVSVEDVASQLLLSKGQVIGLERADASPFYTRAYFLKGLRKYMAFVGVPDGLLDDEPDGIYGLRMTLAEKPPRQGPAWRDLSSRTWWRELSLRTWQTVAAGLAVVVMAAGTYRFLAVGNDSDGPPPLVAMSGVADLLPAQPIGVATATAPSVRALPASVALATSREDSTVRVTVGKATWIFVRYPDNRVVERRLEAGEELQVGPLPVYLAVGTADSVEMSIEDRPVALGPYIRDGQIRITRPELARLAPSRLPE